jgi:hypothetical protein
VLRSIHWKYVRFDVLCIKTDPKWRPLGFAKKIVDYLRPHGYIDYAGQIGRNICKLYLFFLSIPKID